MNGNHRHSVLVTDDDPAVRKVLSIGLEQAGFAVAVAASGTEALHLIREQGCRPDCILLDIRMPGMQGNEVLVHIKDLLPHTPVIMLTATSDIEIGIDTMKRGAFDYLVKPASKQEVIETIKRAIQYRDVLLENERLTRENLEYQKSLELKVEERTRELFEAYSKLQQTNLETVKVLAETIEAKDTYTRGHCNRVRMLSLELANYVALDSAAREALEYGALLHDIGKIGISESLLHKSTTLSPEELQNFRMHPVIGEHIVKHVEFFYPCLKVIRSHHEWYNGQGYPDGLGGKDIDILVRIVAVSDAFDAMTSTRPYRLALSFDHAIEELLRCKGTQFDPDMIDLFVDHAVYEVVRKDAVDIPIADVVQP